MDILQNLPEIRQTILKAIDEKKSFKELREMLPGIHKRPLLSVIFDLMAEHDIKVMPFCDALEKPRLTRKPIPVSDDGMLNIHDLLLEKGFDMYDCEARPTIGKHKITITVKKCKPEKSKVLS